MTDIVSSALPALAQKYSLEVIMRYLLIEVTALCKGRLTTNHVCQISETKRQRASKDINKYNKKIANSYIEQGRKLTDYRPSAQFKQVFTEEYLNARSSNRDLSYNFSVVNLGIEHTEGRHLPLRLHVRAYCEKNCDYRDFMLSCFRCIYEFENPSKFTKKQDGRRSIYIGIRVKSAPGLMNYQRSIIEHYYNMQNGVLEARTYSALVPYVLLLLDIDLTTLEVLPHAKQIFVYNLDEVEQHAFLKH